MSFYSFATTNFTTSDDRNRRPAIDKWQIVRTLAFVLAVFFAFVCAARHSGAAPPAQPSAQKASS